MTESARREYWNTLWNIYYQVYFHELVATRITDRLLFVTRVTNLLTAVTASSSTVAAWTVWSSGSMSFVWAALTSVSALLSIAANAFGIQDQSKKYLESRSKAQALRIKIQSYRNRLRISENWDLETLLKQLDEFDDLNVDVLKNFPNDGMFETKALKAAAQDQLDTLLQGEISEAIEETKEETSERPDE